MVSRMVGSYHAWILLEGSVSVTDTYRILICLGYYMDTYPTSTKNFGYVLNQIPVSNAFGPDLDTAQTYFPARTVARVTNATTPHRDS